MDKRSGIKISLLIGLALLLAVLPLLGACAKEVVREVVKEVPVREEVVKEVVKEVPVEKIITKEVAKEVVVEVPVQKEVVKEVIKEVPVEKVVTKEVIKEVPIERVVEKVVVKEVPAGPTGDLVYGTAAKFVEAGMPDRVTAADSATTGPIFDFTVFKESLGVVKPMIAESWEMSDDGLTWTFRIRKGVQFHDGWGEVTADDVKFSIDVYLRETSTQPLAAGQRKIVKSVEVVDRYTLKIVTNSPWPGVGYDFLAHLRPHLPVLCKRYVESMGEDHAARNPIGSGSWKFVEFKTGDYIKMEAVANHWRKTPEFKTLTIAMVPEASTRLAMLRAGEADIIDLPAELVTEVEKAGFRIVRVGGATFHYIYLGGQYLPTRETFDPTVPWVGDPRNPQSMEKALKVRKALNFAVNREEITSTLLKGSATASSYPPFYPAGTTWINPDWKPYPYDPQLARRLLAEAGYPKGFETTMRLVTMSGRPELPDIGEAVAMYWEQNLGLQVKRVPMDYPPHRADWNKRNLSGIAWTYGGKVYDEPTPPVHSSDTINVIAEYAELDALVEQRSEAGMDAEKRRDNYTAIGDFMYENYLTVPISEGDVLFAIGPRVGNMRVTSGFQYLHNFEYITQAGK